jgi:hypothetical protein
MQHAALIDVATVRIGKNKRSIFRLAYPPCATVVGLVWSNDPVSYAGSSIAAGKVSHARQVKGDDPNKKAHCDLADWVWATCNNTTP